MNNTLRILSVVSLLSLCACSHLPSWMGGAKENKPKLPGERITVLPVSTALTPDAAVKDAAVTLPPVNPNIEWPQHTGLFTASSSNLGGGTFEREDDKKAGEGEAYEHKLVPRPVVGGGMVFAMDSEGHVSAHEAGNISKVRWVSKGVYEDVEQDNIGGGLAFDGGKVFANSGRGLIVALNADSGQEIWRHSVGVPFRSAPKVADGKVLAITIDNQIFALSVADGKTVWSHRGLSETGGWMNSVSPTVSENIVIVPYTSGDLYGLNLQDGKELWSESISMHKRTEASDIFSGIGGDPVVDGAVVFAVSNDNGFSVITTDRGQRIWDRPIASANTPWVSGNAAFLLTTDNTVVCYMKFDGRIRWATKLESFKDADRKLYPITWHGPVLVDGKLLLASDDGRLMRISAADGTIVDTKSIPDDIQTSPVVAGGVMYLMGKNATLYSLK